MITVTRIFEFAYAHQLEGHEGLCKNLHGHNAILEVEVSPYTLRSDSSFSCQLKANNCGPLAEAMVVDFGDLKAAVDMHVIQYLDHKYLNKLFTFHPTAENLCAWVVETLKQNLVGCRLQRVRIWENSKSYAEWKRGE